ncbi:MAG: insulinase family protein [Candidatus Omnitrophica bacterium]|nr:insulinase family protein [Candidatus Omnitrophota bacterium]
MAWWLALLILTALGCQSNSHSYTEIPSLNNPSIQRYSLDNGLVALLKPDTGHGLIAVEAAVRTGSISEEDWIGSGISHFVEHMLFKGTQKRKVGDVEKEIQRYGGTYEAFTSYEYTGYRIVVPSEYLQDVLELLSDVLQNAAFDAEELEKEREVILKELAMNRDDPDRFLHLLAWGRAYTVHPYRHPIIGYESLFRSLTREDVMRYYRQKYVPNNLVLALAGDFDLSEAAKEVYEKFGGMKRSSLKEVQIPQEPLQMSSRKNVIESEKVELAHLQLLYHTVSLGDADLYPLDVLAILLGGGESSYLHRLLHREKELVHDVSCWSYTPRDPGLFAIICVLDPDKTDETVAVIQTELSRLLQVGFSPEDLEKAKRSVITDYLANRQTVQGVVADLISNELLTSDPNFSEHYVAGIQQVTPEDLRRVLEKYFSREKLTYVGLVPDTEGSAKNAPKALQERKAALLTGGMKKVKLPQGSTLLMKRDTRVPMVSIAAAFKGGVCSEQPEKAGLSNFVAQLMVKGTSKRDAEQISNWVEARGGSLIPFSGHNSFGFTLQLMKEDMVEGLSLTADLIQHSVFDDRETKRVRQLIHAGIKSQEEDPFQNAANLLKETLFQTYPLRFTLLGTPETVEKITRKDLMDYYHHFCIPNNLTFSVVGDIDEKQVVASLDRHFESWKGQNEKIVLPVFTEEPITQQKRVDRNTVKDQAMVLMGFRTVGLLSEERPLFEVLTAILSGGSGTLYDAIRQKEGLAYSVGAYGVSGLEAGYFVFYVATAPEAVERVKDLLEQQISRLRDYPVDAESLERAKQELIGNNRIDLQSFSSLAFKTALDECFGLGYQWVDEYESKIRRISPEDLQRTAQTYFDSQKSARVIVSKQ